MLTRGTDFFAFESSGKYTSNVVSFTFFVMCARYHSLRLNLTRTLLPTRGTKRVSGGVGGDAAGGGGGDDGTSAAGGGDDGTSATGGGDDGTSAAGGGDDGTSAAGGGDEWMSGLATGLAVRVVAARETERVELQHV